MSSSLYTAPASTTDAAPSQVSAALKSQPPASAESGQAPSAGENEKGSLSTTLTDARRAANISGAPEPGAAASGNAGAASPTTKTRGRRPNSPRRKKSILSKIKGVLLSCVGPNGAHPVPDVDELRAAPGPSKPTSSPEQTQTASTTTAGVTQAPSTTTVTNEKVPITPVAEEAPAPPAPSRPQQPELLDHVAEVVTSPEPVDIPPPPPQDEEVIVPPSPTVSVPSPEETRGMMSGAVQPPGSTAQPTAPHTSEQSDRETLSTTDDELEEAALDNDEQDEETYLIQRGGSGIPIGPDGVPRPLLPPLAPQHAGRKCLVLDLDETLVHSSFKSIQHADYVVPVEIEYHWHNVYVIKRPGVDNFLKKMGELYEVVVFTASLSKYADPVLDKLDIHRVVTHRLFRESCYNHKGNYVKDLSQLGRPIEDTIILDNSPASYIFHPNNAVPVSSWFNDPHDTELTDLVPFLADLTAVDDVRGILDGGLDDRL